MTKYLGFQNEREQDRLPRHTSLKHQDTHARRGSWKSRSRGRIQVALHLLKAAPEARSQWGKYVKILKEKDFLPACSQLSVKYHEDVFRNSRSPVPPFQEAAGGDARPREWMNLGRGFHRVPPPVLFMRVRSWLSGPVSWNLGNFHCTPSLTLVTLCS